MSVRLGINRNGKMKHGRSENGKLTFQKPFLEIKAMSKISETIAFKTKIKIPAQSVSKVFCAETA
jgi:hypothetical protein